MENKARYEKRIMDEISGLPDEALPKIIRLLSLIKEEFVAGCFDSQIVDEEMNHETTRRLLASSQGNWAQDIIADRADRI